MQLALPWLLLRESGSGMEWEMWFRLVDTTAALATSILVLDRVDDETFEAGSREEFRRALAAIRSLHALVANQIRGDPPAKTAEGRTLFDLIDGLQAVKKEDLREYEKAMQGAVEELLAKKRAECGYRRRSRA